MIFARDISTKQSTKQQFREGISTKAQHLHIFDIAKYIEHDRTVIIHTTNARATGIGRWLLECYNDSYAASFVCR